MKRRGSHTVRPWLRRAGPVAAVALLPCRGCGRPFAPVRPRQQSCRPSCRIDARRPRHDLLDGLPVAPGPDNGHLSRPSGSACPDQAAAPAVSTPSVPALTRV